MKVATNTTLDAKESRRPKPFIEWPFEDALVEACRADLVGDLLLPAPENFFIVNSQICRTVITSHQRATARKPLGSCINLHQCSVVNALFDAEMSKL
jgi:hypothetical protein